MVFNFTHAQNSPSDSMKYEEILKRIDALNTKFDDAINSKDCDKQKSKIEKELAKKSDTIRTLRKENSTLIANNKSLQKTDSINKNDLLKLKEDQIQVKSAISNLEKNKEELESYKSSAEKYKDSKEKQLETIRINLKSNIENSLKIDLAYASAVQLLLTNDSNSKDLINLLSEYLINQKAINEIDSIMRIQNFSNFKEVRTKISTISIKPSFKGQLSSYRRVSNNFETLVELVEKFRKLQTDYKNDDDAKFAYRFQSKVRVDRNDSMVKELFLNYPCLNYYSDLLMDKDNRKTYTLPSTN
jgi:hypothetical protein